MPITNYYSVNGELIGQKVGTGARVDYLTDALGNVTATLNPSGALVNTYRYKPYGGQLAKTGAGADPAFRWVGSQGYRQTGKKYSDVYVRARHYDTLGGRWTVEDPRPLTISMFDYVRARPTRLIDPSGRLPDLSFGSKGNGCSTDDQSRLESCCKDFLKAMEDPNFLGKIKGCVQGLVSGGSAGVSAILPVMKEMCKGAGHQLCIWCLSQTPGDPLPSNWPRSCENRCLSGETGGFTLVPLPSRPLDPSNAPGCPPFTWPLAGCTDLQRQCFGGKKSCVVAICNVTGRDRENVCRTLLHEMGHCGGVKHSGKGPQPDLVYALGCCLCKALYGNTNKACEPECKPFPDSSNKEAGVW